MPRNGAGVYTLAVNPIGTTGAVISLANFTSEFNDLATALTGSIAANGETTITGTLKGFASASPCYAFAGDLTSGFGSPGAGTYNLLSSGSTIIQYTASGASITGTLAVSGNTTVGGTMTITGQLTLSTGLLGTITTTGSTVAFLGYEAISTEAAAAAGPIVSVYRNSASPAASDFIGAFDFNGRNTTPAKVTYARLGAQITDATAGTEDVSVALQIVVAGALTAAWTASVTGLAVIGNVTATGLMTATSLTVNSVSAGGLGFAAGGGAGGIVTQQTNKSTSVSLTAMTGAITMNNAALGPATSVVFTCNNSAMTAADVVIVNIKSGATANSYTVGIDATAAGSFNVILRNISAGSLSEAVVLSFVIIKGAVT